MRAVLLLGLFIAGSLSADTFDWSYSIYCYLCGPFVDGQGMPVDVDGSPATLFVQAGGTFTTTNTLVNGALTITGITGSRSTNWFMGTYLYPAVTDTISGLIPPDPTNPYGLPVAPDNLLFPNGPTPFDNNGVAYTLSPGNGGTIIQIASPGGTQLAEIVDGSIGGMTSFTLTQTPEPAPASFLGLGAVLGIALWGRRRSVRRKTPFFC